MPSEAVPEKLMFGRKMDCTVVLKIEVNIVADHFTMSRLTYTFIVKVEKFPPIFAVQVKP